MACRLHPQGIKRLIDNEKECKHRFVLLFFVGVTLPHMSQSAPFPFRAKRDNFKVVTKAISRTIDAMINYFEKNMPIVLQFTKLVLPLHSK